ncbi:MAG: permease [Terracidiphilus sp.]
MTVYSIGVELPRPSFFILRRKSIVRALVLSLGAFALSLRLAGFPHIENLHGSHWQVLALVIGLCGMAETARCLSRRWSLYHAGILLLLYANLMILAMIIFLVAYS